MSKHRVRDHDHLHGALAKEWLLGRHGKTEVGHGVEGNGTMLLWLFVYLVVGVLRLYDRRARLDVAADDDNLLVANR